MNNLKIGILDMYNGVEGEGLRCIQNILSNYGVSNNLNIEWEIFDVRQKNQVPNIIDFDGFIASGGPGSPLLENSEWEKLFFGFVDDLIDHNEKYETKKPLFAICHSFQLLFQHFNLGIITKRKSTMFGIIPLKIEENTQDEAYFKNLETPFWTVDSRDFQAVQANLLNFEILGAKIICLEKERPHLSLERAIMAIRFTNEIFGTQFHPEADGEGMYRLFQKPEKKKVVIENHGEEKYFTMLDFLNDPEKIEKTEATILPNFLDDVMSKKYQLALS